MASGVRNFLALNDPDPKEMTIVEHLEELRRRLIICIVVVTAGSPRKPGMSRDDLVTTNQAVMNEWGGAIKQYAPNAVVIVLSRSGKSVEIVRLLDKCSEWNAKIIAVTNSLLGPQDGLGMNQNWTLPSQSKKRATESINSV